MKPIKYIKLKRWLLNGIDYHLFNKKSIDKTKYPRIVTIRAFLLRGCTFEVTNHIESYRIESYGDEDEFSEIILGEIHKDDIFYDIGACVGFLTIHAARKGANVVAFEPEPDFRRRIIRNISLNKLNNIQLIDWAVSDSKGFANLVSEGAAGNSPRISDNDNLPRIEVQTDTIDAAISRNEIPPPNVIKIDIEGAEILALRGMERVLAFKNFPRAIFIELHPEFLPNFNSSPQEVSEILSSHGYVEKYCRSRNNQVHCLYKK